MDLIVPKVGRLLHDDEYLVSHRRFMIVMMSYFGSYLSQLLLEIYLLVNNSSYSKLFNIFKVKQQLNYSVSVSYTHLTLPTILLV